MTDITHSSADSYILARDANEAQRLNIQHGYLLSCQGYHLHPDINLPSTGARIAELCIGTATFLREIAEAYPAVECHGFDISDKMYPPQGDLPKNVQLHVANVKEPFDERWLGYFDVVHIRLICAAMKKDEWGPLLRNITTLLRPGGWVQWVEGDMPLGIRHTLRPVAPLGAAKGSLLATVTNQPRFIPPHLSQERWLNDILIPAERADEMAYGYMNLDKLMKDKQFVDLERVNCDSYVVDRQDDGGELRRGVASIVVTSLWSMIKAREVVGDKLTDKSREEFIADLMKDVVAGAHYAPRVTVNIGRTKS